MSPSGNWCGTEPSEDLNIDDQASPPSTMSTQPEEKAYYPCVTQDDIIASGNATEADVVQDNPPEDDLVVGVGTIIPRWSGTAASPAKLLYFTVRESFPDDDDFEYTAKAFQDAAEEWNAINFGVTINATSERAEANFVLVYYKPPPSRRRVIASAFFPNKVTEVLCYEYALSNPRQRRILKNTFLHEIGHIIGLRHEFAIEQDALGNGPEGTPAVYFGSRNPLSVMSYEDVANIQDTDKEDVVKFYQLPNNFKIGGLAVTDFNPKPLPISP